MKKTLLLFVLLACGLAAAASADRALVVGIGEYADHAIPVIPGVERDVAMMREVLSLLGFEDDEVRVLRDAEATRLGLRTALRRLARETSFEDRVVVYHSGHGTRVRDDDGDEDDDEDEALLPYDARIDEDGDPRGVLLDDEIGELLAAIPAREVVVLVDACFSGTVTRGPARNKFYAHPGLRDGGRGLAIDPFRYSDAAAQGVVLLSASGAAEEAQATPDGALFTQGVLEAVRRAAPSRRLTLEELRRDAEAFIARRLDQPRRRHLLYRPQLDGPDALRQINLFRNVPPLLGLRERLEQVVRDADASLAVDAGQGLYRPGDALDLRVRAPQDGYLHVLNLADGEDAVAVLFPNAHQRRNRVRAGDEVHIPGNARFRLVAFLPAKRQRQENVLVALLTAEPLPLGEGPLTTEDLFAVLEGRTRAIVRLQEEAGVYSAGGTVVTVLRNTVAAD